MTRLELLELVGSWERFKVNIKAIVESTHKKKSHLNIRTS
jgi:hypothetical protein